MKAVVERDQLAELFPAVSRRAVSKHTLPILRHVLMTAKSGKLSILGNDLDSNTEVTVPAEVSTEGSIALPADRVQRLLSGLPSGSQIKLQANERECQIICGSRIRYRIPFLTADEFPPAARPSKGAQFTLTGEEIAHLFGRTRFAYWDDISRPYTSGAFLTFEKDGLFVCGTDHKRMMVSAIKGPEGAEDLPANGKTKGVIIPLFAVEEIRKLTSCEKVKFKIEENLIEVREGSRYRFCSKLTQGIYPPFRAIIPTQGTGCFFECQRDEMLSAVRRLLVLSEKVQDSTVDDVALFWKDDHLTLESQSGLGGGNEKISAVCGNPPEEPLGIPGAQLREMLEAFSGEKIRFEIKGSVRDHFRIVDPDEATLIGMQTQVRLKHNTAIAA